MSPEASLASSHIRSLWGLVSLRRCSERVRGHGHKFRCHPGEAYGDRIAEFTAELKPSELAIRRGAEIDFLAATQWPTIRIAQANASF